MSEVEQERLQAITDKLIAIGKECVRAINTQTGAPYIIIRGHFPEKGWPRGKCCGSDSKGRFYGYDARKVLAKIISLGLMTFEFPAPRTETDENAISDQELLTKMERVR